jgi:processive 1,2-diacylglycerol beta-glucosyltransferase
MINILNNRTDDLIGEITESQLAFLIDQLEEESQEDEDYAITPLTLQLLEAEGADEDLLGMLVEALGEKEEIEIRWES